MLRRTGSEKAQRLKNMLFEYNQVRSSMDQPLVDQNERRSGMQPFVGKLTLLDVDKLRKSQQLKNMVLTNPDEYKVLRVCVVFLILYFALSAVSSALLTLNSPNEFEGARRILEECKGACVCLFLFVVLLLRSLSFSALLCA
jgi:hypothetical protein